MPPNLHSVDPSAYISSINILHKEDVKAVLKPHDTRLRVQRAVAPDTRVAATAVQTRLRQTTLAQ